MPQKGTVVNLAPFLSCVSAGKLCGFRADNDVLQGLNINRGDAVNRE